MEALLVSLEVAQHGGLSYVDMRGNLLTEAILEKATEQFWKNLPAVKEIDMREQLSSRRAGKRDRVSGEAAYLPLGKWVFSCSLWFVNIYQSDIGVVPLICPRSSHL